MTNKSFIEILTDKRWKSSGTNTLNNRDFNPYPPGDWRHKLIFAKEGYYPPKGVQVQVIRQDITRSAYTIHHADSTPVPVPEEVIQTFTLKVTGDDFEGREKLESARFIVVGDRAISSPIPIRIDLSLVILVRLYKLEHNGKYIMVNELIWTGEPESELQTSATFYDVQKWYCCGFP